MKALHKISFVVLVIGGLNWLLVGLIGWDIGQMFGGQGMLVSRIIYIVVGIAAIIEMFGHKDNCKQCTVRQGGAAL